MKYLTLLNTGLLFYILYLILPLSDIAKGEANILRLISYLVFIIILFLIIYDISFNTLMLIIKLFKKGEK